MTRTKMRRVTVRAGFTMVELMAVLVVLGLLMAVVAKNVVGRIDRARVTTTIASLKELHGAVIQFKFDTGRYPSQEAGLQELVEQPSDVTGWDPDGYLLTTDIPTDAWGRDFIYELYPVSGKAFVIYSYGADGQEGGEGYDADLLSTDAK